MSTLLKHKSGAVISLDFFQVDNCWMHMIEQWGSIAAIFKTGHFLLLRYAPESKCSACSLFLPKKPNTILWICGFSQYQKGEHKMYEGNKPFGSFNNIQVKKCTSSNDRIVQSIKHLVNTCDTCLSSTYYGYEQSVLSICKLC